MRVDTFIIDPDYHGGELNYLINGLEYVKLDQIKHIAAVVEGKRIKSFRVDNGRVILELIGGTNDKSEKAYSRTGT